MSFLGIDIGTSGLRALLTDASGKALHTEEVSYGTSAPSLGWSEQDPKIWIEALEASIGKIRQSVSEFRDLSGICVSGHMHGATLLDNQGNVLRPCILWNDQRSEEEAQELDNDPKFREISGNIVFPGFTAPKLHWVSKHEPEIFAKIAKVLLPASFLNHYLTGEFVADFSDCSGTSWLDVGQREWSLDLLKSSNLRHGQMPNVIHGCEVAGTLRIDLARKWGVGQNVIVAGGAGDNAAAACGMGVLNDGQAFVSLGTSGVVLIAREKYSPLPETAIHTFCHAVPNRWYQMGVMLSATDSLNWLSCLIGLSPSALTAKLPHTLQRPNMVRFMPYMSGERTPHNDAKVRGGFLNLSLKSDAKDLIQAVLEGVSFALRDCLTALQQAGATPDAIFALGGGTRSDYWLELLATVLNKKLLIPDQGDFGPALGAARLARIATTNENLVTVLTPPVISREIDPNTGLVEVFNSAYFDFQNSFQNYRSIKLYE